jgi:hypothetical protein
MTPIIITDAKYIVALIGGTLLAWGLIILALYISTKKYRNNKK